MTRAAEPIRRIVIGAQARREGVLLPQIEPINLYCLNPPGKGVGAVLLDSGFYMPKEFQRPNGLFPTNYERIRACAIEELRGGLKAHGYDGLAILVFSHGHIDHMGLAFEFQKEFGCAFWASRAEQCLRMGPADQSVDIGAVMRLNGFEDGRAQEFQALREKFGAGTSDGASWAGSEIPVGVERILEDDEVLDFGGERYRVSIVHGHSKGQALLVNETRPGDFAIHGGDQIQRNEPPTFLSAAGERLGLAHYVDSMARMFARHPGYREIRRIYPAHARTGHLEHFEREPIETLGQWWNLCHARISGHLGGISRLLRQGALPPRQIFEEVYASELAYVRSRGMIPIIGESLHFMQFVGRLDYLEAAGWEGARIEKTILETEGGPRARYEVVH